MKNKTDFAAFFPRTSYALFLMDIPRLKGRELQSAIQNKLAGLYPGNLNQRKIAIEKNGTQKGSHLVFVIEKEDANKPLPVSTLFVQNYFVKKDAYVLFSGGAWIEYLVIEKGTLTKSLVKPRPEVLTEEHLAEVFGPEIKTIDVFCPGGNMPVCESGSFAVKMHATEKEVRKTAKDRISLFSNLSPERKRQRVLLMLLGLSTVFTGTVFITQYRESVAERNRLIRVEQEQQDRQREEAELNRRKLAELEDIYKKLITEKTAEPYEVVEALAQSLGASTRIISATIRDGFFQFDASSPNALAVLDAFEKNPGILSPMLQQIRPSGGSERFTMTGTVLPEIENIDTTLSPQEQIAQIERLIADSGRGGKTVLSPSLFGVQIRSLLTKWNCTVSTFQYLSAESGREIEFSVRAASGRFFGFLQEASLGDYGWEFTLVQIRNLAPQNALDVVFRIKANTIVFNSTGSFAAGEQKETATPLPIPLISRNYYVAPAVPAVPRSAPVYASPPPARIEQASWLEYLGAVDDNILGASIYVKNTRTGGVLRLRLADNGDMRYRVLSTGNIEAHMDGRIYEIRRNR